MPYRQDIRNCFADAVGATGLEARDYENLLKDCDAALDAVRRAHDDGSLPLLRLPARSDDIEAVEGRAADWRETFDDVIVLGTGGSSLGGRTLAALADYGGGTGADGLIEPRLHFMDNIDGHSFETLFRAVDPVRTGLIAISKSGRTAETLTQFLYCLDLFRAALGADALGGHFTVITEPGGNPLRRLAERFALPVIDHDPGIGGRFAALSVVGLLPALIAGTDAYAVRAGADAVLAPVLEGLAAAECPPAQGAAIAVGLARTRGIGTTVLMPYVDRLADFGLWFRQLWAESLGKDGNGTTPVNALGTVDQHSQLQLYLAGPADKVFTLVLSDCAGTGGAVPADLADDEDLAYLAGRRMGDLLDAEQRATAETLVRRGRPVRTITLDQVDERALGALMMHFMLETMIAAELLGVNAFDQPAVEEGKVLARRYLEEGGAT